MVCRWQRVAPIPPHCRGHQRRELGRDSLSSIAVGNTRDRYWNPGCLHVHMRTKCRPSVCTGVLSSTITTNNNNATPICAIRIIHSSTNVSFSRWSTL